MCLVSTHAISAYSIGGFGAVSLKADCTTAQSGRPCSPTARTSYLSNYDRTADDVRFSRTASRVL